MPEQYSFYKMSTKRYYILLLGFLVSLSISCGKKKGIDQKDNGNTYNWATHVPFKTNYSSFGMPITNKYEPLPDTKGHVELSEASGIAYSTTNPGKIWAHNDSGHPNTLFLIDENTGEIVARYQISGTVNTDWEDMEVSVGPTDGQSYIYISDTGDNDRKHSSYTIYRFAEPRYEASHYGKIITITDTQVDRILFRYPDGKHDTEALLVDPLTKDIFLATKSGVVSYLYAIPYPQKVNEIYTIYKAGDFSFRETSAATASLDGQKVLIKNRQEIFYWERNGNESMVKMLSRTPEKAPYIGEPQGEAICFGPDYNYFTLSEKANFSTFPILYKYHFKQQ